ncbi:MAG: Na(+)/H(+) antiporter subunit D [Thermodesulfobacteriota bacterium]
MSNTIIPAAIFIIGALLIPFLPGRLKSAYLLALPVLGLWNVLGLADGSLCTVEFAGYQLSLLEVDKLSRLFAIIFHIITFITILFVLNFKDDVEYVSGYIYAGCALGVIFAGDLLSLFFFWEGLTVGAMFLILARKTKAASGAAFRYTLVHAVGGLLLLAGIVIHGQTTGSFAFGHLGLNSLGTTLIFLGFGVNCAWPLLHSWLVDAYPEATIGGAVFLSAFTTKTAVYVLARAFAGEPTLIWLGTAMAAFPIFFAVIENDLRRVLAYSLINQVGFMVVGLGIGTELAINGALAHAFNDILFKGLLFMSVGAVMYRTGKVNATDLGGLYKCMPWTCLFCIVGAASISAFPLFSGFVSKSLVMSAAAHEHLWLVWFTLLFAAAGVFHHAGIKIPFFTFFSHDAGHRVKEAPLNMLLAMGIAAFGCIFVGTFPQFLYDLLPYEVAYEPYTYDHVMGQTQLLFFSAMAFTLLLLAGIYPAEMRSINLDFDWTYRKGGRLVYQGLDYCLNGINRLANRLIAQDFTSWLANFCKNGQARLTLFVTRPFCLLHGMTDQQLAESENKVIAKFKTSNFSIASTAIFTVAFLLLLLLFL